MNNILNDGFEKLFNSLSFQRFDVLREDLNNEIKKHYRGETSLRYLVCDLLKKFCGVDIDYKRTMLHHKNGSHEKHEVDNLILFPITDRIKNPNASIHNMARVGKFGFDMNKIENNPDEYLNQLFKFKGIDVWKSICAKRLISSNGAKINIEDWLL